MYIKQGVFATAYYAVCVSVLCVLCVLCVLYVVCCVCACVCVCARSRRVVVEVGGSNKHIAAMKSEITGLALYTSIGSERGGAQWLFIKKLAEMVYILYYLYT